MSKTRSLLIASRRQSALWLLFLIVQYCSSSAAAGTTDGVVAQTRGDRKEKTGRFPSHLRAVDMEFTLPISGEDDDHDHDHVGSTRKLEGDGTFNTHVRMTVEGYSTGLTSEYHAVVEDIFKSVYNTLSSSTDDDQCSDPQPFITLEEVTLLPETIDTSSSSSDLSNFTFVLSISGSSLKPCGYFAEATETPDLFSVGEPADGQECEACTKEGVDENAFVLQFNVLYAAAVDEADGVDGSDGTLESEARNVVLRDVEQIKYPICEPPIGASVNTFTTTVVLTADSDLFANGLAEAELRFIKAYDEVNAQNGCFVDPLKRRIISVRFDIDEGRRNLQDEVAAPTGAPSVSNIPTFTPRITIPKTSIDIVADITGDCVGCPGDQNLFDQTSAGSTTRRDLQLGHTTRTLQQGTCNGECRGPTTQEFMVVFQPGGGCVVELDSVDCPVTNDDSNSKSSEDDDALALRSYLDLEITLNASSWLRLISCDEDAISSNDDEAHPAIVIIENLFLATYNGLVAEYCDPFGRIVVYTETVREDNDEDDGDLLKTIEKSVKKYSAGDQVDKPVTLELRFLVVRLCRRGTVDFDKLSSFDSDEDSDDCDGLFFDTITDLETREEEEEDDHRRGRKKTRNLLRSSVFASLLFQQEGLDEDEDTFEKDFHVTLGRSRPNFHHQSSWEDAPSRSTTSSVLRRGLLVSSTNDINTCYCPNDSVSRRPPRLEEFRLAYEEILEYVTSEEVGNCTNPFAQTSSSPFAPSEGSFSDIGGICPWKGNDIVIAEEYSTLPPTDEPTASPSISTTAPQAPGESCNNDPDCISECCCDTCGDCAPCDPEVLTCDQCCTSDPEQCPAPCDPDPSCSCNCCFEDCGPDDVTCDQCCSSSDPEQCP